MPWQDILLVLNTVDTFAGVLFLAGSWFGFRAWSRSRAVQTGLGPVEPPLAEDAEEDEAAK